MGEKCWQGVCFCNESGILLVMSSVGRYLTKNWRNVLSIVTLLAMALLVYALREQILDTLKTIQRVNYFVLLLMIPLQILNYWAYARFYGTLLDHLKQSVSTARLFRVTLELNFVNNAFPSGGISGISFFGLRLRRYGVSGGSATLLQLIKFLLVFVSFQVLIAFGLFVLAAEGGVNNLLLLIAAVLATLTIVGTFLLAFIVGSKSRINATSTFLAKMLNRVIQLVRPKQPETINLDRVIQVMGDIHGSFKKLRSNVSVLRQALLFALLANITEVLTVYVVYIAFGEFVNIGAVIIAYAIANFAGMVSVLPGGVGIYEALMTAALAAGGIPAALSIPVVVMYRILSMALQLIPGWFLYHDSLKKGQAA